MDAVTIAALRRWVLDMVGRSKRAPSAKPGPAVFFGARLLVASTKNVVVMDDS